MMNIDTATAILSDALICSQVSPAAPALDDIMRALQAITIPVATRTIADSLDICIEHMQPNDDCICEGLDCR